MRPGDLVRVIPWDGTRTSAYTLSPDSLEANVFLVLPDELFVYLGNLSERRFAFLSPKRGIIYANISSLINLTGRWEVVSDA